MRKADSSGLALGTPFASIHNGSPAASNRGTVVRSVDVLKDPSALGQRMVIGMRAWGSLLGNFLGADAPNRTGDLLITNQGYGIVIAEVTHG